jgi:positive regulator of sigma E activity
VRGQQDLAGAFRRDGARAGAQALQKQVNGAACGVCTSREDCARKGVGMDQA